MISDKRISTLGEAPSKLWYTDVIPRYTSGYHVGSIKQPYIDKILSNHPYV